MATSAATNGHRANANNSIYLSGKSKYGSGSFLFFDAQASADPLDNASCYGLFVDSSSRLSYWNGTTTVRLTGGGSGNTPTWEDIYAVDSTMALTTAAWTITQSANAGNLILTKTGTGAGSPLVINNAGTADDIQIVNTDAGATGAVISTDHQSATPADNDVILTLEVNANDDGGGANEFASIKFIATDVSAGTEDAAITFNEMIAGTSRKVFDLTGPLLMFGYGAAATLTSQGAYDLVLETNSGTNSSTITITDGTNGNIALALDGTGVATISTGLQVGGTTPTASIFNVAGSGGAGTTGYGFKVNATTLTTGTALLVDSASSASGLLLDLQLATVSVFSVSETGAMTVAGSAGNNILTITAGDVLLSDASITVVDADEAVTLSITNDAATTLGAAADTGVAHFTSESVTTGVLLNLSLDETNLNGGFYLRAWGQDAAAAVFTVGEYGATVITTTGAVSSLAITSASTTADIVSIAASALTTGDALQITNTAETLAAGELLKIVNTEDGNAAATPKTGNLVSVTSSVTQTTASATFNYDNMLISRSDISNNAGFTLTSQGSTLKVLHTSTQTAGTLTDTSVGLEVEQSGTTYTGTLAQFTNVAVGAKTISVVSACTTVDDVLIAGSGVKADNKATLQVTNSGATAAGGSTLRVIDTGTPAAATSYLVDFDRAGATMTNNPVGVYINNKDSTAAAVQITGSGAMAGGLLELNSTAAGALGAVLKLDQTANSAAASDVIGRVLFTGQDDANAAESYGRIDCIVRDTAAANPDASLNFLVDRAGTVTLALTLGWDTVGSAALNGALVGDGAATAYLSSQGAYDLVLETNGGTNSGTITITDAANQNITITPNGSGKVDLANAVLMSKTESIGAGVGGAIDVVSSISELATDAGGDAYQLADGAEGQIKFIVLKTDGGGDAVITPANPGGYATITMADAGDFATLLFTNGKWYIAGQYGCTVA